jgi:serine/threonine-protein kinase
MDHDEGVAIEFGPYRFEPGNGLWRGADEVPLPPRALGLLAALVARPGVVVSKRALMDAVWPDAFVTEASLLEAIRVLREALGDDRLKPRYIQTVHRRGYRFIARVSRRGPPAPARGLARSGEVSPEPAGAHTRHPTLGVQSRLDTTPAFTPNVPFLSRRRTVAATVLVSSTVLAALTLLIVVPGFPRVEPPRTMRFTITLAENTAIDPLRGSVAVSADGLKMVYVALDRGHPRLFLRTVDEDEPRALGGSDGASDPFFSPDGGWIGFFADGSLKTIAAAGGPPVVLAAARAGAGASWGRDGTIVFGGGPGGGLARVPERGGEPRVLAEPPPGSRDIGYGWPDVLPDGSAIIATAMSLAGSRIVLVDPARGVVSALVDHAAFGRYSPTGHLVFERRGRLEAAAFSIGERRVMAPPRPILRGLASGTATLAGPRFAFSETGSLVYVPATSPAVEDRLHWLDINGRLEPIPMPPAPLESVDVAPDLRRLAVTVESEAGAEIWVGDLGLGALSRLPSDGLSASPTWRPDGLEIAFAYSKAGPFNLFVRPPDPGAPLQALAESPWNQFPTSWSPDGRLLAFTEVQPMTGADVWVLDVATRERRPVVRSLFDESHARFSPDGRWLAYMSNDTGRWNVFVQPADGAGARVQISTEGGAWPCWSVDGRTVYFSANGLTAAATVQATPRLRVGRPIILAGRDDLRLAGGHAASDRVLVRQDGAAPARHELRVVLGWFVELARLARRGA